MNLKTQLLALAALLFTATSCSDNNAPDPTDPKGTDSKKETLVTVRLASGSAAASRNHGDAATEALLFGGGHMYFTSMQGTITRYYKISATDATDLEATPPVLKLSDLQASDGLELESIPANSDSIFITGNVPGVVSAKVGDHIRDVQSHQVPVGTQRSTTDNITVYGVGKIVDYAEPVPNKKQAAISVNPLSGRIEITKFTYSGSDITGYNVEAVYINNYYPQMRMDGYISSVGDSVDHKDNVLNYLNEAEGAWDVSDKYKESCLWDWEDKCTSESGVVKLDKKLWVYNVLAPLKSLDPAESAAQFGRPHIIVRLNKIATAEGATKYTTPMYLTMRLKDTDTGKEIVKFLPGTVYQVKNIEFKDGNLYTRPEMAVIDVTVKVTLVDWTLKATGVILN